MFPRAFRRGVVKTLVAFACRPVVLVHTQVFEFSKKKNPLEVTTTRDRSAVRLFRNGTKVTSMMSALRGILLQKSFCRRCQKFRGPQARFSCRDLRDLIASR